MSRQWSHGAGEQEKQCGLTRSIRTCARRILRHLRGCEAANGRQCLRTPPSSRRQVRKSPIVTGCRARQRLTIRIASSGACATIASDAFMNSFDVIKQRMQLHGSTYRTITECARHVFRSEGLRAFYVSYPTTLTMTVPFTALQFTAYESLQKALTTRRREGYDPLSHCVAGGLAGGFAAAATTPLDVVKTLLQTRGASTDAEIRHARVLSSAASIIWRREGAKGFFRGMKARVVTAAPSTAICWSAYELAKAYFIRIEEEK